jgi:hypothetical protein
MIFSHHDRTRHALVTLSSRTRHALSAPQTVHFLVLVWVQPDSDSITQPSSFDLAYKVRSNVCVCVCVRVRVLYSKSKA